MSFLIKRLCHRFPILRRASWFEPAAARLLWFGVLLPYLVGCGDSSRPVPTANAGGPYSGIVGQAISLDASHSSAPAGLALSYSWDFGDGTSAAGVRATHSYATAGSYSAVVTLTAAYGVHASDTAVVTVAPAPMAHADAGGPYAGTVNQPVTFDGTHSTAPAGELLTYRWDFGDGGAGTGASPTHTYNAAGSYRAVLTADASGGSSSQAAAPSPS